MVCEMRNKHDTKNLHLINTSLVQFQFVLSNTRECPAQVNNEAYQKKTHTQFGCFGLPLTVQMLCTKWLFVLFGRPKQISSLALLSRSVSFNTHSKHIWFFFLLGCRVLELSLSVVCTERIYCNESKHKYADDQPPPPPSPLCNGFMRRIRF